MLSLIESQIIPEPLIRVGIRQLLKQKLREERLPDAELEQEKLSRFIAELRQSPIAIEIEAANSQHYEVPTALYQFMLGPRLKYSCGLWLADTTSLAEAEENMLSLYCKRASIEDGQRILDLGCGWGSLSLYLAERYPKAEITAISNSRTQKEYIDERIAKLGLVNLKVITANIVDFDCGPNYFDRVLSIEMFEHMKNYKELLAKISRWLKPEAKLFVHIFAHKDLAYHYQDNDGEDWLTRHFFLGGTMPSNDLLLYFQDDLKVKQHWVVSGTHYEKTANAWLANMKKHKKEILPLLSSTYGAENTRRWWLYWQLFYLACAELWGYEKGRQWFVSHYLFEKPAIRAN